MGLLSGGKSLGGLLGTIGKGAQVLANNPNWNAAVTYGSTQDPMVATRVRMGMQEAAALEEQRKQEAEREKRRAELEAMQMQALKAAQDRETYTRSMLQAAANNGMQGFQSPEQQADLQARIAAYGDPSIAQAGGLLQPQQKPGPLPSSYQEYLLAQQDPGYAAVLRQQVAPPSQIGPKEILGLAGRFAPESITAFMSSGNPAALVPIVEQPKLTAADARAEQADIAAAATTQSLAEEFKASISSPEFSGAVGAIDSFTAPIGASLFGTKEGVMNRRMTRLAGELVLDAASKLKGVMSDKDLLLLKDTAPTTGDQPEVWEDWYNNSYVPKVNAAARIKFGRDLVTKIGGGASGGWEIVGGG